MSEIVYNVPLDIHGEDVWDDSALIKAYDRATRNWESRADVSNPHRKKRKLEKKGSNGCSRVKDTIYSKGDACQAIYAEDGYVYNAVVEEIFDKGNDLSQKLRVRFEEYGNVEDVDTDNIYPRVTGQEICVGLQAKYTKKSPGGNIAVLDIIVDSVNDDGLTLDVTVLPEGACEKVSRGSISIASLKESRAVALRTANQSSPLHSSGLNHTLVSQASSNKALAPQSPLSASITSVSSSPTVSNNLEETEPMDPKFSASVAPNHTQYRHNKHGASPSETFPPKGTPVCRHTHSHTPLQDNISSSSTSIPTQTSKRNKKSLVHSPHTHSHMHPSVHSTYESIAHPLAHAYRNIKTTNSTNRNQNTPDHQLPQPSAYQEVYPPPKNVGYHSSQSHTHTHAYAQTHTQSPAYVNTHSNVNQSLQIPRCTCEYQRTPQQSHSCCNVSSAGCNAHTQPRSYAYLPHHEDVCVCDGAQPTNGQTAPRMPKLPPMGSATSVSDEALGEMLMSWYHAGYTTGRMQSAREYEGVGGCDCRPY